MLKAYIFDFEGTLVDFQWNLEPGMTAAKAKLEEMGFDPEKLAKLDLLKGDSYHMLYNGAVIDALTGRLEFSSAEVREKIGEVFDFWDADALTRWRLREEAKDALNSLHRKATVGLFTIVGRKATIKVLQKHDIDKLFHIVVTRNDVTLMKPYDEGLRLIRNALGILPEEMIFVGDSGRDCAAAKEVGARFAFITGGEQELSPDIQPDYVIHSLLDVQKIK